MSHACGDAGGVRELHGELVEAESLETVTSRCCEATAGVAELKLMLPAMSRQIVDKRGGAKRETS